MRPLASIYSHRVSGFMETQVGFNPIQKKNSNPKRKVQTRPSVDRPVDRPMPRSTGPVDRATPKARSHFSRSTGAGRSLLLCMPVHAGRPGGRPASSTGRPGGRPGAQSGLLNAPFLAPLTSDLCATSFHLFYLLSPTKIL